MSFGKSSRNANSVKAVPWASWEEWCFVHSSIFSADASFSEVSAAIHRITAWRSRGHLPIAIEITGELKSIQLRDPYFTTSIDLASVLPEEMLRLMYAMVIMRLINGVVDHSKNTNSSVAIRAEAVGLPRILVDTRHEVAHRELPALSFLQVASKQALEWLKDQYWERQNQVIAEFQTQIAVKLHEYALLFDEMQRKVELNGSRSKICSKQIKEKHKELRKLRPEVKDMLLIIVNKAILEQSVVGPSEDAWKSVVSRLCRFVPDLKSSLLVQLAKEIAKLSIIELERVTIELEEGEKELSSELYNEPSGRVLHFVSWFEWLVFDDSTTSSKGKKKAKIPSEEAAKQRSVVSSDVFQGLLRFFLKCGIGKDIRTTLVDCLVKKLQSFELSCAWKQKISTLVALSGISDQNTTTTTSTNVGSNSEPIDDLLRKSEHALAEVGKGMRELAGARKGSNLSRKKMPRFVALSEDLFAEIGLPRKEDDPLQCQSGGGAWVRTSDWRPCAIGMCPSTFCERGVFPSLDSFHCQGVDERVIGKQNVDQDQKNQLDNEPTLRNLTKSKYVREEGRSEESDVDNASLKQKEISREESMSEEGNGDNSSLKRKVTSKEEMISEEGNGDNASLKRKVASKEESTSTEANGDIASLKRKVASKEENMDGEGGQVRKRCKPPFLVDLDESNAGVNQKPMDDVADGYNVDHLNEVLEKQKNVTVVERAAESFPFGGLLLQNGEYQICDSKQLNALRSAIHVL